MRVRQRDRLRRQLRALAKRPRARRRRDDDHRAGLYRDAPEARERFKQLGNDRNDGVLVISIAMAREITRGWVEITGPAVPSSHEEFRPFDDIIKITERVDGREAFICRSNAIRLDMEILEPNGAVAIDFKRGDPLMTEQLPSAITDLLRPQSSFTKFSSMRAR